MPQSAFRIAFTNGLITREELKQRKINVFVLLITLMLAIPLAAIVGRL